MNIREISQRLEQEQDGQKVIIDTGRFWTQAEIDAEHPGAYMVSTVEITTAAGIEIREVKQDGSYIVI